MELVHLETSMSRARKHEKLHEHMSGISSHLPLLSGTPFLSSLLLPQGKPFMASIEEKKKAGLMDRSAGMVGASQKCLFLYYK